MQYLQIGKCTLCDKPGVGAINGNANAGATAPPKWEPRCDEHNPYWNPPRHEQFRAALERISDLKPAMANTCPICRRTYDGTGEPHEFDCPVGIARTALKGEL